MYTEDNSMFPRETISDELLARMLDNTKSCCNVSNNTSASDGKCIMSKTFGIEGYPLASMYAPLQNFKDIYDKETALHQGTLFSELDLPFMGIGVTKGGCYDR